MTAVTTAGRPVRTSTVHALGGPRRANDDEGPHLDPAAALAALGAPHVDGVGAFTATRSSPAQV